MGYPEVRPRRLRRTPALRRLVAETSVEPRQLVLPVFVREGATEPVPITSMPGKAAGIGRGQRVAVRI